MRRSGAPPTISAPRRRGGRAGRDAPPASRKVRLAVQVGLVVLIFGFLVYTVIQQWAEIQDEGVHFHVGWLIPALVILPFFFVFSALGWDFILRFLGHPIGDGAGPGRLGTAAARPLRARQRPLRAGPGPALRTSGGAAALTIASIAYEQAISATSAIVVAAYFIVQHPDLQGEAWRWAVLLLIPAAIALLHPRVFGPLVNKVLGAFGREPLPAVVPLRGVILLIAYYSLNWFFVGVGIYSVARSVTYIPIEDIMLVASAQAIGYFAALVTLVAPAGLGVKDAAFAWALKAALPGKSFALASLVAIAVRGVMTVGELIYVGIVTAMGRREGWSIHTGSCIPHPRRKRRSSGAEQPL